MADVGDYVAAEMENLEKILREMPPASAFSMLSTLELAGVAALLHSFYLASQKFLGSVGMTSSDGDGSVRVTDTIPGTRIAFKPI